jgi:hypothetical protein
MGDGLQFADPLLSADQQNLIRSYPRIGGCLLRSNPRIFTIWSALIHSLNRSAILHIVDYKSIWIWRQEVFLLVANMWICIILRRKSGHRQLLQFCYYFFDNLRQKIQHKGSFSEFRRSSDWFFAERVTERSRASCSCGSQTAALLLKGAEQPWEFSAPIRSLNRSKTLLTAQILDPPHLC